MSAGEAQEEGPVAGHNDAESGFHCDFCGLEVASVTRVALDGEYERLRTPHNPLYACPACSEQKERERLGPASG